MKEICGHSQSNEDIAQCTVQYSTLQYSTVQYSTVLYSAEKREEKSAVTVDNVQDKT